MSNTNWIFNLLAKFKKKWKKYLKTGSIGREFARKLVREWNGNQNLLGNCSILGGVCMWYGGITINKWKELSPKAGICNSSSSSSSLLNCSQIGGNGENVGLLGAFIVFLGTAAATATTAAQIAAEPMAQFGTENWRDFLTLFFHV